MMSKIEFFLPKNQEFSYIANKKAPYMILYSVTYNIEKETVTQWLHWMKTSHIPAVMATELPIGHKVYHLLTEVDNGGETYSCQYFFTDIEDYETYQNEHSPRLRNDVDRAFRGKYVAFRTLLQEV